MPRHPRPGQPQPKPHFAAVSDLIDSALTSPRAGLSGQAAIKRMAEDMRQAAYREGGITEADLYLLGWTEDQLTTHCAAARQLADAMSGLTV
jgi:hypothetical protein